MILKVPRKTQLPIHPSPKKYKSVLSKEQFWGGYLHFATSFKNYIWAFNYFIHINKSQRSFRPFVMAKDNTSWSCLVPRQVFRLQIPNFITEWFFWGSRQHKVYIFTSFSGCLRKGNRFSLETICAPPFPAGKGATVMAPSGPETTRKELKPGISLII